MKLIFPSISNKHSLIIFIFSFVYSLLIALFIQKYLIPNFFPSNFFIAGKELNLVVFDSVSFHNYGLEVLKKLKTEGFTELQMFYQNNFLPNIVGILYYIFYPDPVVILPLNSLVHAITSCIIYKILCLFFDKNISFISSFIFIIHPQALEWTSQIHRDGIFCLGIAIFIFSSIILLEILKNKFNDNLGKNLITQFLLFNTSLLLISLSRSYFLYFLVICLSCLIFLSIFFSIKDRLKLNKIIFYIFYKFFLLSITLSLLLLDDKYMQEASDLVSYPKTIVPAWQFSAPAVSFLDDFIYRISLFRFNNISLGGTTIIDNILFNNVTDFILYFPNAFLNGLFSPFPKFWYGESSSLHMTYAKIIIGFITFFSYFLIFIFAFSGWKRRLDPKFIYLCLILIGGICLIGYSCVNTGTLLRYRYIFYILILCFGLSFLIEKLFYKLKV